MCPKYQIDIWIAFPDFFRNMFLLHHTAAYSEDHVLSGVFTVGQLSDASKHLILRIFPYGTGVVYDQVCIGRGGAKLIPHPLQHSLNLFSVTDILLASEGMDMGKRRSARVTQLQKLFYLQSIFPLPGKLIFRDQLFAPAVQKNNHSFPSV